MITIVRRRVCAMGRARGRLRGNTVRRLHIEPPSPDWYQRRTYSTVHITAVEYIHDKQYYISTSSVRPVIDRLSLSWPFKRRRVQYLPYVFNILPCQLLEQSIGFVAVSGSIVLVYVVFRPTSRQKYKGRILNPPFEIFVDGNNEVCGC